MASFWPLLLRPGPVVVGLRVRVDGYEPAGTVRFVGPHHERGTDRVGVELDGPEGKNNGTVKGQVYFECPASCGLLAVPKKVHVLI